jgi:hypothetical protein
MADYPSQGSEMNADQHPENSHEFLKKEYSTYTESRGGENASVRMNDAYRTRVQTQQADMNYIESKVPR